MSAVAQDRTYDGSGNNLLHPSWGQTGEVLRRSASGARYADGIGAMVAGPSPRAISNAVAAQTLPQNLNARALTSMFWQWGQFIDHDFALVEEGTESAPIGIPMGDPIFDPTGTGTQTMPFSRSQFVDGVASPRQHRNALTHWIDGSMVYGSDAIRATALREGSGGRLLMGGDGFLPRNTMGLPNGGGPDPTLFVGGDVRVNEQVGLITMHTVFAKEHNYWANRIAAENPMWTDEQVYQRARKVVGAEVQAITYNEWLPSLLGPNGLSAYSGYDSSINPNIDTAFSTAAFRIGHTLLNGQLLRFNEDGSVHAGGHLNLAQSFFNIANFLQPGSYDALIRGLAFQQANEIDLQVIDEVRNLLFGPPGSPGRDLVALNIQRGRDHGIPHYNQLRADYGLTPLSSFSEVTSDPAIAAQLQALFGDINSVDAFVGLLAEDHLPGASVGQTMAAIFRDQFFRLREGDRYFYLNDPTLAGLWSEIEDTQLSDILRRNSGVILLQGNVFMIPAPGAAGVLAFAGLVASRRRRRR
ncbi:MAG: peroxidase family protein [Phycisphaerae bacterium]|nr:peroxidase family protein [Phycisphaerae bacterium]